MTDPALRYLAVRRDLSRIPRIIDHLLKEAAEHSIGSEERLLRIKTLRKLLARRNELRREEDNAAKSLMGEEAKAHQEALNARISSLRSIPGRKSGPLLGINAVLFSDDAGKPLPEPVPNPDWPEVQRRMADKTTFDKDYWEDAERLLERLLADTTIQRST